MSRLLASIAFTAGLALGPAAWAATVALVTDVVGDAAQGGEPLKLLGELPQDAELALPERSQVVVFYLADGSEWTLSGPGRYKLTAKGPEAARGTAVPLRKATAPAYRDLKLRTERVTQGGIVMRGYDLSQAADRPALIAPVNETVVSPEVRFSWESFGDGAVYQFELVDPNGQKLLTAETTDTEVRLPPSITMKPLQVHYWAVRGRDASGGQTFYRVGQFRLADAATRRRLEAAQPKADAAFSERVLYAALLEDAGARSAALALRRSLAAERPVGWAPPRP